MNAKLYVYEYDNLDAFKCAFDKYKFYSISHYCYLYTSLDLLDGLDCDIYDNSIIDLTNLIKDASFYRVYTESYILKLQDLCENIHFCVQKTQFPELQNRFPHLFDRDSIDFSYSPDHSTESHVEESDESKQFIPPPLYTYSKYELVKNMCGEGQVVSISELMESAEGMIFRYNTLKISQRIQEKRIQYIDISSMVRSLNLRADLIFQFEILLVHILKNTDVKICADESIHAETLSIFPAIFNKHKSIVAAEALPEEVTESSEINIDTINAISDQICNKLKGHDYFKAEFRRNLLKFTFLNKMSERKILSIMLCGDSGIGKTEFAKIVSKIIYPGEPLVKINFGNYSNEGVLNSLIGSPLGYVGSEEGGELINKISTSKTKVILIDEFEKATPSVYNFFYELLEDGKFTDRHGIEHNMDGYLIVFTSNMNQAEYAKHIPNSLKSRFDMVYYFVELPPPEKLSYIYSSANELIDKFNQKFETEVDFESIKPRLDGLTRLNNLRDIKREIEDRVFDAFFERYSEIN